MYSPIAGIHLPSMVDYPGKTCAVIYTQGCNLSCGYCHNHDLIAKTDESLFMTDKIKADLEKTKKYIDAVTITGGEPTLHGENLVRFCEELKNMGFLIKLDTNGSNRDLLSRLLSLDLLDYVALDWKSLNYLELGKHPNQTLKIMDMLNILKVMSGKQTNFEIRTTMVLPFVSKFILHTMCYVILETLQNCGNFKGWYWQKAKLDVIRHSKYNALDFEWVQETKKWLKEMFKFLPVEEAIKFRNFENTVSHSNKRIYDGFSFIGRSSHKLIAQ